MGISFFIILKAFETQSPLCLASLKVLPQSLLQG